MNPPLSSIPERINARLHMMRALAMTMEYVIPPITVKNRAGIWRFSKQLKAMKKTQKQVAFAETITKVFQICVWKMEVKIPAKEGGGLWRMLRDWIIDAFAMRRKERVKGRTRSEEVMVWESLRLRMEKNSESGGKPAARKSERSREWTENDSGRREEEEERRSEAENGIAKMAAAVKKW